MHLQASRVSLMYCAAGPQRLLPFLHAAKLTKDCKLVSAPVILHDSVKSSDALAAMCKLDRPRYTCSPAAVALQALAHPHANPSAGAKHGLQGPSPAQK